MCVIFVLYVSVLGEKNQEKRLPIDNPKVRVGLTFNNLESMILKISLNML